MPFSKHCSREIIAPYANGHAISLTKKAHDFLTGKNRQNIKSVIKKAFQKILMEFPQEVLHSKTPDIYRA